MKLFKNSQTIPHRYQLVLRDHRVSLTTNTFITIKLINNLIIEKNKIVF